MAQLIEPFAGTRSRQVAERLIRRFGTLGRALVASPEHLATSCREDREVLDKLGAARKIVLAAAREEVAGARVSAQDPALHQYLTILLSQQPIEQLHVVFVSSDGGYIADERVATGTRRGVEANLRQLVTRSIELSAAGLIIAHNHPSGSPEPSEQDIDFTRRTTSLLAALEIELIDHLIIGGGRVTSMRMAELL